MLKIVKKRMIRKRLKNTMKWLLNEIKYWSKALHSDNRFYNNQDQLFVEHVQNYIKLYLKAREKRDNLK